MRLIEHIESIHEEFGFTFDEESHSYTFMGKAVPFSVSRLAKAGRNFDFTKIPNIDYYREIGNEYHYVAEATAKCLFFEKPKPTFEVGEYDNMVEDIHHLIKDREVVLVEQILYSMKWGFSGKLDLLLFDGKEYTMVDFKTSKSVQIPHKIQLRLYREMLLEYGIEVKNLELWVIDKETGFLKVNKAKLREEIVMEKYIPWAIKTLQEES